MLQNMATESVFIIPLISVKMTFFCRQKVFTFVYVLQFHSVMRDMVPNSSIKFDLFDPLDLEIDSPDFLETKALLVEKNHTKSSQCLFRIKNRKTTKFKFLLAFL